MAIKIPSSNIYEIKHSPIRNNIIDNVEIGEKKCQLVTGYHDIVYNNNFASPTTKTNTTDLYKSLTFITGENYYIAVQQGTLELGYTLNLNISFPRNQNKKRITSIYDKVDKQGRTNIGYTINYEQKTYDTNGNITLTLKTSNKTISTTNITRTTPTNIEIANGSGIISDDDYVIYTEELEANISSGKTITYKTTCSLKNQSTIPTATVTLNEDTYTVTLNVLSYIRKEYLRIGKFYTWLDYQNDKTLTYDMKGKGEELIPKSIDITIYGDTINLNIEDIVEKINNKDNRYSIDANELIQTTNIVSPKNSYNDLIDNYKDGKETAVIRCSISDYKDDSGVKVIDITTADKMCFEIGDEVIPMVYTANGVDMPMSTNRAGNAKVFIVIGKKPYYDGAVWQELTIQEKTN